jgi:hypothetical protein
MLKIYSKCEIIDFIFLVTPMVPLFDREEANAEKLLKIAGIQRISPLHKLSFSVQLYKELSPASHGVPGMNSDEMGSNF